MTTLYVAGPMSGLPEYNLPAFAEAAERLEAVGYTAVNPGRHGVNPEFTWRDYIRRGIVELLDCDGIALLPGWEGSRGGRLERFIALELDMKVQPLTAWLEGEDSDV